MKLSLSNPQTNSFLFSLRFLLLEEQEDTMVKDKQEDEDHPAPPTYYYNNSPPAVLPIHPESSAIPSVPSIPPLNSVPVGEHSYSRC